MKTFSFIISAITVAVYFASLTLTAQALDDQLAATAVPFTEEANYMSLPGFLRWRQYLRSGEWISREEAITRLRSSGPIVTGRTPVEPVTGFAGGTNFFRGRDCVYVVI